MTDGSLGLGFPGACPDGRGTTGTDFEAFGLSLKAEISEIPWPFETDDAPPTLAILDLVEFAFRNLGKPMVRDHHSYFGHDHLSFDRIAGQSEFHQDINRIFARNGLAFELGLDGKVIRLGGPVMREFLAAGPFATGDSTLNSLLEAARGKFLDPDPKVRREGLEKLWDAWERLKTIGPGTDKKATVTALLNQSSSEPSFRGRLETEARELTSIGNSFHIRHSETTQVPLSDEAHVDYLFHRLFALIWLLLRKNGLA